jgi:hypothetical protein
VGIGVNFIGRKVGQEIKKWVQLIFEARKDDNRQALLYNSGGEDSVPIDDERLVMLKVDGAGKYVVVGVLTQSQGAKPGEKIFFGRDQKGNIVSKIKLLNDGSISINTEDETTGEAAGDYRRKIKGATEIHEMLDRTYKNGASVSSEIDGNKDLTVHGNMTTEVGGDITEEAAGSTGRSIGGDSVVNIQGKFYFGNNAQNTCAIWLKLIDLIEGAMWFGAPALHKIHEITKAQFEGLKNDVKALYKESA